MTSSLGRWSAPVLVLVAAGCGVPAPDISVAATCTMDGVPVQLEVGVTIRRFATTSCEAAAAALGQYRTTYEARWGEVALSQEQWTIRIRTGNAVDADGHTGVTYHHSYVVDVAEDVLETFPHELRHVQLGQESDDHHGWCEGFEPWEERVLGVDERTYLGCRR